MHLISVRAGEDGLSLGQVACDAKSDEITALPELLRLVDIEGAIITIDAMGAQKAIAEPIIAGGADDVLALKAHHETLHQAVIAHLDEQLEGELSGTQEHMTRETAHGREETRTYLQLPVPDDLPGFARWKGLKTVGLLTSCRSQGGQETIELRDSLSSLEPDVREFARAVRGHCVSFAGFGATIYAIRGRSCDQKPPSAGRSHPFS